MRIGILHLDVSGGPEVRNRRRLETAIEQAAAAGAEWIITPEMAVQGYFMALNDRDYLTHIRQSDYLEFFRKLSVRLQVRLFLGAATWEQGKLYNSCLVFGPSGELEGVHHKTVSKHGRAEQWAVADPEVEPVVCGSHKIGVLVCADAWYEKNAEELAAKEADMVIVIAAWPPGCGGPPEAAWERCSAHCQGVPVVVCNQTGTSNGMNCTIAKSALVLNGKLSHDYEGADEKIILLDLSIAGKDSVCRYYDEKLFRNPGRKVKDVAPLAGSCINAEI